MAKAYSEERYQEAVDMDEGFCTSCQEWTREMCEPDAEEYDCPECGQNTVYGAEQALLVGHITIA